MSHNGVIKGFLPLVFHSEWYFYEVSLEIFVAYTVNQSLMFKIETSITLRTLIPRMKNKVYHRDK